MFSGMRQNADQNSSEYGRFLRSVALQEKHPNPEFFLVRVLPYSDWERRFTVFSSNIDKYGPEQKTSHSHIFYDPEMIQKMI